MAQQKTITTVIGPEATLLRMPESQATIPRELVDRVAGILRGIVDRDFGKNGTRAAKQLGISQAQVSGLYSGNPGKGVGLGTLLALRRYTKRSLDDLCGLSSDPLADEVAKLSASIDALKAKMPVAVPEAAAEPAPRAKRRSKAKWTEMQEVDYRARAQAIRDKEAESERGQITRTHRKRGVA